MKRIPMKSITTLLAILILTAGDVSFAEKEEGWNPDTTFPPLTVELLDGRDCVLPSYSATITVDGTQRQVVWPKAASLPSDQQIAVRVKFAAKCKAHVCSLYVTE